MDLWLIFLTGLTVGGITCMAVQGGLLASTIAAREEADIREGKHHKHTLWPVIAFLSTKLVAYLFLGLVLGAFGSAIALSESARVVMQLVAAVYMIAVAMNLLNVHPIFRYAIIQPPRLLTKIVRNQAKSNDLFAPAFLGLVTIFIPCGTTLAMEALAISSGNALTGAAIMGAFTLGTSPLFFGLGFITTILGDTFRTKFLKLAAVLVLYLGITSLNGGLLLAGSPITLQTIANNSPIQIDLTAGGRIDSQKNAFPLASLVNGTQIAHIFVSPTTYQPNYLRVKAGVPLQLTLATNNNQGCTSVFRIPQLGVNKNLPPTGKETIVFTPIKPGKYTWTCSMGMYTGTLEVI